MDNTNQTQPRKGPSLKTVIILLVVFLFILFCGMNLAPQRVWPFGSAPLFVVLFLSFSVGLVVGWLGNDQARRRRKQAE